VKHQAEWLGVWFSVLDRTMALQLEVVHAQFFRDLLPLKMQVP
jgi:hypothetical protein